jgi:hypothetical protein
MGTVFQVRYNGKDGETVAHEHETEKGAKADAKKLSKAFGEAQIGEIQIKEDGTKEVTRSWKYAGGKGDKPELISRPITDDINVVKSIEETKAETPDVVAKEKSKLSPAEKLAAKIKADTEKLEAIKNGTYVPPARKPRDPNAPVKEKKVKGDDIEEYMKTNEVTREEAEFLVPLHLAFKNRRAQVALLLFRAPGRSLSASAILDYINSKENETGEPLKIGAAIAVARKVDWVCFKKGTPWAAIESKSGDETIFTLKTGTRTFTPTEDNSDSDIVETSEEAA